MAPLSQVGELDGLCCALPACGVRRLFEKFTVNIYLSTVFVLARALYEKIIWSGVFGSPESTFHSTKYYDFSGGVRAKHFKAYRQGHLVARHVFLLIAEIFI